MSFLIQISYIYKVGVTMNIYSIIKVSIAISACGIFILANTSLLKSEEDKKISESSSEKKVIKYIVSKNSYF